MKKDLYIILSHDIDTESASNALVGVHRTLDAAIVQMRDAIYHNFEDIKEWWEETDEEEDSSEEQYQEWIDDNFLDDQHTLWSYTDDDPVEHKLAIHTVEVDDCNGDLYAIICTRVDGMDNKTVVLGVYNSQASANEALEAFESDRDKDGDNIEVVVSVEKLSIE
jgi:hypothetical protein